MQISLFCRSVQRSWEKLQRVKESNDIQAKINGSEVDVVKQKFRSIFRKRKGFDVKCQT
jgi:hypothetical protein